MNTLTAPSPSKSRKMHGPKLPGGWGTLYNAQGYRQGRVYVTHIAETARTPHVVCIGVDDYPLFELTFSETTVMGVRHATIGNGVWEVIMDAPIAG